MAFVIVSTGALARSRLHTVRLPTLIAVAGAVVLVVGIALGFRLGQTAASASLDGSDPAADGLVLDPARPENRALIDGIGALSGRLIRLESEAIRLARRVGLPQTADDTKAGSRHGTKSRAIDATAEPSGGPWVAPLGAPASVDGSLVDKSLVERTLAGDGFAAGLQRLGRDLDRIEANLSQVSQATSLQDLNSMAFPSRRPIPGGRISSGFGNRVDPFTRRLARHTGLDMPAPFGAPILASAGGRVRFAGRRSAYGKTVEIDHGNGLVTRYGHASKLYVHTGDVVLPGQRIAAVGSTGRSTGPHLHFEVLSKGTQVEPRLYLARGGL